MRCVEFPNVAMIGRGSAYIFICPDFFKLPARDLLQPKKCPTVANNLFQPPQLRAGFFYSQAYYLLIPLIRFYLGQKALPADELKVDYNDCVRLGVRGLGNAWSIAYYTAFVEHGCKRFPDPSRPPFNPSRGTLTKAASGNGTDGTALLSLMPSEGDIMVS